jgi:Ca2+-binding RTX toxin-like protein
MGRSGFSASTNYSKTHYYCETPIMTTFNGTNGNDIANRLTSELTGFSANTLDELTDAIGDIFNADDGDDVIISGIGDDILNGGNGNDTLNGNLGNNLLNGEAGDDTIISFSAFDTSDGGLGNDYLAMDIATPTDVYVSFTSGNAGIVTSPSGLTGSFQGIEQYSFYGGDGNDYVDATLATMIPTSQGIGLPVLRLRGFDGNDSLIGAATDDTIEGENGNDTLLGRSGNDTLLGGEGFDYLAGEDGNDTLSGDTEADVLDGGNGNDILNGGSEDDILLVDRGLNAPTL